MASVTQIAGIENYVTYTNVPNTFELTAAFDIFNPPDNIYLGGVKGALDKVCVNQLYPGIYQIFIQDIFGTIPYPRGTPSPVLINVVKPENYNSQKILHAQVSLSNWVVNPATPTNHRAYVWWWCPSTFPTQMAPADPSIQNSLIVSIFNTETGIVEDVVGMRAHIMVTVVNQFDNANIFPGLTDLETN